MVEHVIFDQTQKVVLRETTNKHMDKNFAAGKSAEALGKRMLSNDEFRNPIASLVQTKTMGAIADQCNVEILRTTSMETMPQRM